MGSEISGSVAQCDDELNLIAMETDRTLMKNSECPICTGNTLCRIEASEAYCTKCGLKWHTMGLCHRDDSEEGKEQELNDSTLLPKKRMSLNEMKELALLYKKEAKQSKEFDSLVTERRHSLQEALFKESFISRRGRKTLPIFK